MYHIIKKWVCYRTAIAQAGCSFLFLCSPCHTDINFRLQQTWQKQLNETIVTKNRFGRTEVNERI